MTEIQPQKSATDQTKKTGWLHVVWDHNNSTTEEEISQKQ